MPTPPERRRARRATRQGSISGAQGSARKSDWWLAAEPSRLRGLWLCVPASRRVCPEMQPRTSSAPGTRPRATAPESGRLSEDGLADVVADHHREQHPVEAVEDAAVRAEQSAGVLHVEVALDRGLEQVAERRGERHAEADQQRVGPLEPVVLV